MNTALGLGYAEMFKNDGRLLIDCAHFRGLSIGIISKVLTGQAYEPLTEDPDVNDTLTVLSLLLLEAQRPNWVPCYTSSYQQGLEIMWEHYLAVSRVCDRSEVDERFFRKNTILVSEDARVSVTDRARVIVQDHIEQAKELWKQFLVYREKEQAREAGKGKGPA